MTHLFMRRRILTLTLSAISVLAASAQVSELSQESNVTYTPVQIDERLIGRVCGPDLRNYPFRRLDIGVNLGSTGIGIELGTNISDYVALRMGFDFIPHFEYNMRFQIQVGDSIESKYDKDGNRIETRFDRMAGYMEQITGLKVDDEIEMIGEPHFNNFKLIADVYPFRNKKWYFSAGFYLSKSSIGKAYNRTEDMASLLAVSIYNNIYGKVEREEGIVEDLELPPDICDMILKAGRMGMHVGDFKEDGTRYMMVPDQDNMVKATLDVNAFKPYLGAGYTGTIGHSQRLSFAVNAGVLFWGGTPKVYTHDGTEIIGELTNIWGQVNNYIEIIKPFKVFPILNASISYRLF